MGVIFGIALLFVVSLVLSIFVWIAYWYARLTLSRWFAGMKRHLDDIENEVMRAESDQRREAKRRKFLDWLDVRIGSDRSSGSVNPDVLEAQRQTVILRRLIDKEVPDAILRCVKIHDLAARVVGAEYIKE